MILDTLDHADFYRSLSADIAVALDYLRQTDFAQVTDGRYPLGDGRVVAIVSRYTTKLPEAAVWESHRKHIDVQYVATGHERMGYVALDQAPAVKTPFNPEKDVILYEPARDTVTVAAGQFTVFFPQDVHAPSLADGEPSPVLKVVIKVPVSA